MRPPHLSWASWLAMNLASQEACDDRSGGSASSGVQKSVKRSLLVTRVAALHDSG
jgi:hypothetical protein